ncbi:protein PERCC1 [Erpetoichthys calabaricus]|uniref:Proline and glutamate rich with coiled coil 1 n=1 Tax=Erpetoichthys calabaricus TaxID=27687 RepID=A0A8C4T9Q8_ERPCA|nr:protein PERCC1 [Erpetoichthys calabaricus]
MAAGVIRSLNDFRLIYFQLPLCTFIEPQDDMDFQDASTEEEEEEDGQVEEAEFDTGDNAHSSAGDSWTATDDVGPSNAEMTYQLLHFIDLINCDIQRYFGKKSKEDDPDACDIYEDRFFSGKSAREQYYADLIKMAQSGDPEEEETSTAITLPREASCHILKSVCNRDSIQKLGPLAELFDYGLRRYVSPGGLENKKGEKKYHQIIPMCKRSLPPSFWTEPSPNSVCMLPTPSTPDFSDLLANWTYESSHNLHEVSRSSSEEARLKQEMGHFHMCGEVLSAGHQNFC